MLMGRTEGRPDIFSLFLVTVNANRITEQTRGPHTVGPLERSAPRAPAVEHAREVLVAARRLEQLVHLRLDREALQALGAAAELLLRLEEHVLGVAVGLRRRVVVVEQRVVGAAAAAAAGARGGARRGRRGRLARGDTGGGSGS